MSAVAVGKFDALHRGHRRLVEAARLLGPPILLRFSGMAEALGWAPRPPLVASADRSGILAAWEAREAAVPFAEVRPLDPPAFIDLLVSRLGATAIAIGEDFHGGPGRRFAAPEFAAAARARGLAAVVQPLLAEGGVISSSRIRDLLAAGQVSAAADLLGRPHRIAGTVILGDGRGRDLGIPTANIGTAENLVPAIGVYAARAVIAGVAVPAVINIGRQPTVGPDRPANVEAHLLGWSGDLYGQRLALDLVARIRAEERFPGLDALVARIHRDIAEARRILAVPS